MKNHSPSAKKAGMIGCTRSPMAGHMVNNSPKLNPSIAANTTTPGIAKASAPIRSPMNKGAIVRYSR
jgi:hypothetical protein